MNLARVETRKVDALDAWRRGALADADAAYRELACEYERHHFAEGLLAVRFNHLLVALEAGDRPRVDALMTSLGSQLLQVGQPTPLVQDVARRICRLFVEPVPGVDHQATTALVALASDKAGGHKDARRVGKTALPTVATLLELHPEDAALVILRHALRQRPTADEPGWLAGVRQVFGASQLLSIAAEDRIRDAAEAISRDDLLRGYPALVDAFEWAMRHAGDLAAEWAIGLSALEAQGLPERLRYVPTMPQDRRQRATVHLHARLAEGLSRHADCEVLARRHWSVVERLGQEWLASSEARGARGGGRADDVVQGAEIALRVAQAERISGRLTDARSSLAASVARARRDAFDDRELAARVLLADADLRERLGDDAATAWRLALDVALPGAADADGIEALARIVDRALGDDQAARALHSAPAFAGLARTGPRDEAMSRLRRSRIVLAMLRPALTSEQCARASLAVELSGARLGDEPAARRALEAAQIVGDRPAVALALLHTAWRSFEIATNETERERALDALAEAAAQAHGAAAGQIRRAVEAAVARAHRADQVAGRPARVNIHVRRAIEAAEGAAFADGVCEWDACLPEDEGLSLAHAVDQLIDNGSAALARRLCAAGRRTPGALAMRVPGELADHLRAQHRAAFRAEWLGEGDTPAPLELEAVGAVPHGWPALRVDSADLQIELRVLDDVTYLFGITDEVVRGHRIERGARDWSADVDALRAAAHAPGTRLDAVGTAIFHRLLGPVKDLLASARRLVIVPDGPLFDLPFALLRADRGCLGEHCEIILALSAPPPVFAADSLPAPATALIIGDDATARDLRISTLSGQGFFRAVDVRHGADLSESQLVTTVQGARVVHILGELEADAHVGLVADDGPTPVTALADALGAGGTVCATLMGPVEGAIGQDALRSLLPGARGGVLIRRWETDEDDGSLLLHFLAGAAHAVDSWALAEALAAARRAAIRAELPPAIWAAYTLTVALD